jgi:RNA polymerase I-specific transcription initiation factor RRN3
LQFARVARATDFVYCYSILEANKRSDFLNHNSTSSPAPGRVRVESHRVFVPSMASSELNTFFPFDPYKLPKSSSYIDGVYREWSSVAIADDEEDEEDDVAEDTKDRWGMTLVQTAKSQDPVDGGLGASFEEMSISPARPVAIS